MGLSDYTLTAEQIAKKLGYNAQYVRFLTAAGKLPAIKRGRAWRYNEAEVLAFFKRETAKSIGAANGHK